MDAPHQRSWIHRHWPWLLPLGCVLLLVGGTCAACAGCFGVAALTGREAITSEVAQVQRLPAEAAKLILEDEGAQKLLGAPLEKGEMSTESYRNHNGFGEMRFTLELKGAKQPGLAEVQAVRAPEQGWQLRQIVVKGQDGDTSTVLEDRQLVPQVPPLPR